MMNYPELKRQLEEVSVTLVAVSKMQPVERILELYDQGHRDFGENYVQELVDKAPRLPGDIRWHFIGHLQSNKVRFIAPFVYLIQGVDSLKLLREIDKQARRHERVIDCLLQVHIAREETKFGFDEPELDELMSSLPVLHLSGVRLVGFMGMASNSGHEQQMRDEFRRLRELTISHAPLIAPGSNPVLSMGMSGDYQLAISEGSNLVRIGSLLFGARPARS